MSQLTRIGFGSLGVGFGSITLPEKATLQCPNCGTPVADKGQCVANFEAVPNNESKTGFTLKVMVDCRVCDLQMKEPDVKMF